MARYNVVPRSNGWAVEKNGRTISTHRKQRPAIKKARRKGSTGDQLTIHKSNGQIRESSTIR